MIGMIQYVGYLVGTYMCYRGVSDALRDLATASEKPLGTEKKFLQWAAIAAIMMIPVAIYLVMQMDQFAIGVAQSLNR